MRILKNIGSQLHIYLLWVLLAALLWGWIFTFVTDTTPARKVTVFIDAYECRDKELSLELEKHLPRGIRMIKVHPFSYAMFDAETLLGADLYVIPASKMEEYRDSFIPAEELSLTENRTVSPQGGIRIYEADTDSGGAWSYITYTEPGTEGEDYYLFFGAKSLHAAPLTGSGDDAALAVAELLLNMK